MRNGRFNYMNGEQPGWMEVNTRIAQCNFPLKCLWKVRILIWYAYHIMKYRAVQQVTFMIACGIFWRIIGFTNNCFATDYSSYRTM